MIDDSVKALNLATNEEVCFDSHTTPVWAVVYGWCQQHNKLSWLFSLTQKRIWQAEFQDKIRYGSATVNMGDWSAVLREADRPEQHAYTKAVLDNVNVSIKRAHQNALGQWVYFVDDGEHTFYINESRLRNFK